MVSWRRFQPRLSCDEACGDRGTKGERPRGGPSKEVGLRSETRVRDQAREREVESSGVDTQEKPQVEQPSRPYRKPTQVGKASSLR